jgi:hypothetical protein
MEDIMAYTTDNLPRKKIEDLYVVIDQRAQDDSIVPIINTLINGSSLERNERHFLGAELLKLSKLPTGSKLINNISAYLRRNPNKKFSITMNPGGSAFDGSDPNDLRVNIDLGQFQQDNNGYYMNLPEISSRTRVSNQDTFEISPGRTPLHIALGHELVHFNHFIGIDGKTDKHGRPKVNRSDGNKPAGRTVTEDYAIRSRFKYPELKASRVASSELFTNAEERKTVIGKGRYSKSPDDGISEMSLRMEAGLNPRYIYQGQQPDSHFLESADTVRQVIGDRNYQRMMQLPFKQFVPPAQGSAQEEIFLRYTPLSILREIYPLQKAQQLTSVSGTGALTIKDRQQRLAPEKRLHNKLFSQALPQNLTDLQKSLIGIFKINPRAKDKAFSEIAPLLEQKAEKIAKSTGKDQNAVHRAMTLEYNSMIRTYGINSAQANLPQSSIKLTPKEQNQLRAKLSRMLFKRFIQYS